MDFDEKDAARSKHKMSKKNQRGRGRGRGVPGWRGSSAKARQTRDLGTNADRYNSEDDLDQPSEGPIRQSQGADLAEWLDQFPPEDALFHSRQRVNLHEEVGLPPADLDTFQGLSFDLKGLAEVLSKLPLHQVLRVPPPIDEDGNRIVEAEEEMELYHTIIEEEKNNAAVTASLEPLEKGAALIEQQTPLPPLQPPVPAEIAAKKPPSPVELVNKLDKMNIHASTLDVDDELDALLGLGVTAAAAPKPPAVPSMSGKDSKAGEQDSLEAWLDNL